MRILSQDLRHDFPYEKVCIEVTDSGKVFAQGDLWGNSESNYIQIAEYSTEEKAKKAMEMLHGAYCGEVYLNHGDYEVEDIELSQFMEKKIKKEMSKPHFLEINPNNPAVECKYFKFPNDEEIEVQQ